MKVKIAILFLSVTAFACNRTKTESCCNGTAFIAGVDSSQIALANIFTPNGDGRNDILFVHTKKISSILFSVSKKSGTEVFITSDPAVGWDGSFKGKPVKEKEYTLKVEATTVNGKPLSIYGKVCVIRDNCTTGPISNCYFDSQFNGITFDPNLPSGESIKACN